MPKTPRGEQSPCANSEEMSEDDAEKHSRDLWRLEPQSFLVRGAMVFINLGGMYILMKLLDDYASSLKPLVLATIFVWVLEPVVQFFEFIFLKSKRFFVWIVVLFVYSVLSCCSCGPRNCVQDLKSFKDKRYRIFTKKWQGKDAGERTIIRLLSVVLTLTIVVLLVYLGFVMIIHNVENMDVSRYGHVLKEYNTDFRKFLNQTALLPPAAKAKVTQALDDWFSDPQSRLLKTAESKLAGWLASLTQSSISFVVSMIFFLLYTILWLFEPLKLDTGIKKKEKDDAEKVDDQQPDVKACPNNMQVKRRLSKTFNKLKIDLPSNHSLNLKDHEVTDAKHDDAIVDKQLQEFVYDIMKTYFKLKTLMNATFGLCVYLLLHYLEISLPALIGAACFLLSYIPEVGAFISIILPIPLILLDPNINMNARGNKLLAALGGMLLIKLLVSNMMESVLMGRNHVLSGVLNHNQANNVTETHPVLILFAVVVSGQVWGQVGMLISVPAISLVRLTLSVWDAVHNPQHGDSGDSPMDKKEN